MTAVDIEDMISFVGPRPTRFSLSCVFP
jgi:hypothetical protein